MIVASIGLGALLVVGGLQLRQLVMTRTEASYVREYDATLAELLRDNIVVAVRGDVDAYVHAGGQWEWDSAAPVGVARAAGLHTCRLDGSPMLYNRPDPYLPDLLICRADLGRVLLDAIHR